MTEKSIKEISKYCDRYGNKLVELMDRCNVYNTPAVPEEKAIAFIEELKSTRLARFVG